MGRASKSDKPVFNRIEEERRLKGYSRRQFASEIGVHYQTIGYLERGEFAPSLHMALRLSEVLDVPIADLFSLTPFDKPTDGSSTAGSSSAAGSSAIGSSAVGLPGVEITNSALQRPSAVDFNGRQHDQVAKVE